MSIYTADLIARAILLTIFFSGIVLIACAWCKWEDRNKPEEERIF